MIMQHLTMIISKGQTKVAQYGYYNGEPAEKGLQVLRFLQSCNLQTFSEKVNQLSFFTSKEAKQLCKVENWEKQYPQLNPKVEVDILNMIYNGQVNQLIDGEIYAADSMFCKWAYVIDLDKNVLEIYRGNQTFPLEKTERFYKFQTHIEEVKEMYYPIKWIQSYSLIKLPNEKDFVVDSIGEKEIFRIKLFTDKDLDK